MQISVKVQRLDDLTAALRMAPDTVRRYLAAAVEIIARDLVEEARAHHRYTSRHGVAGLEGMTKSWVDRNNLSAEVGFRAADVPYGSYVHDGTQPHKIRPRDRKALRWATGQDFVFAKDVNHPGTRPDPFLYQAASTVDADAIFARHVDLAIEGVFGK